MVQFVEPDKSFYAAEQLPNGDVTDERHAQLLADAMRAAEDANITAEGRVADDQPTRSRKLHVRVDDAGARGKIKTGVFEPSDSRLKIKVGGTRVAVTCVTILVATDGPWSKQPLAHTSARAGPRQPHHLQAHDRAPGPAAAARPLTPCSSRCVRCAAPATPASHMRLARPRVGRASAVAGCYTVTL